MLSAKTLRTAIDSIIFAICDSGNYKGDEDFTALSELFVEYNYACSLEELSSHDTGTTNDKLDV